MTTHGHHQMVNTEIILIIFFAAEDGEALYSQQNLELIVAELMSSVLKIQAQLKKAEHQRIDAFDIDHSAMSMCRVISSIVGRGCFL